MCHQTDTMLSEWPLMSSGRWSLLSGRYYKLSESHQMISEWLLLPFGRLLMSLVKHCRLMSSGRHLMPSEWLLLHQDDTRKYIWDNQEIINTCRVSVRHCLSMLSEWPLRSSGGPLMSSQTFEVIRGPLDVIAKTLVAYRMRRNIVRKKFNVVSRSPRLI